MPRSRKILIWTGAIAGCMVVLALALALILPQVLNMNAIGRNVAAELETRYHVHSDRIEIRLFPHPRLIIHGAQVTIPETITASAESMVVSPKVLPLFVGKFVPAEIELRGPLVTARLPEAAEDKPASPNAALLKEKLTQALGTFVSAVSGIVVNVEGGSLELHSTQGRLFSFTEINLQASVRSQEIKLELAGGKSDFWTALTLSGSIDPSSLRGAGTLNLTGGTPQGLIQYLFPSAAHRIGDSLLDLSASLSSVGPHDLRADISASVPHILVDGDERVEMKNGSLTGSLLIDNEQLDISLSRFHFDYPQVSLTGRYLQKYAEQTASLDINGSDTDAATVRRVLLSLDKENKTVRDIFDIVREGEVPDITFSAHLKNPSELEKLPNYTIKGSIKKGVIFAPEAELLISNVTGDVTIADGILTGTGISGGTAGTSTRNGEIRIGLHGSNRPFHLDLPLDADLSELPPVLDRVVKSAAFKKELSQIRGVKGRAQGRLVLGEVLGDVEVKVEANAFQFACRYGRLPDPIELEGASFTLEGPKVTAGSVTGSSGKNRMTRVNLSYDWGRDKLLEIQSPVMAVLSMELVQPFLHPRDEWDKALDGSLQGSLVFNSLNFRGPINDRSKWVFQAKGSVEDVSFQTKHFTGPVTLKSGGFELTPDAVTLREINAVLTDSTVTLSGKLDGYLDRLSAADLAISGKLGPEGNKNAVALAEMPPALRAISNLTLERSHFAWQKGVSASFEGEMKLSSGPAVSIHLIKTPEELSVENLTIKDPDSDASISLKLWERQMKVTFAGLLSNRTADKLLTANQLLTGPMEGKFSAHLYLDTPKQSTAQGQISISGFQLPRRFHVPARIENATLEADGSNIAVKSAALSWNGSSLNLSGNVLISETAYLVDMNAHADSLDLDSLLKSKLEDPPDSGEGGSGEQTAQKKLWDSPLKGIIHLRSQRLTYGKFTWNPAIAEVSLSRDTVDVKINQATLCGISTPGTLMISPDGIRLVITPSAKDQDIQPALACLFDKQHMITGSFTLKGNLAAGAKNRTFTQSMDGDLDFKAKGGRIYRYETFAKIMSMLSITEIYRGVLPDLFDAGCPYSSIILKGKIRDGKLTLSDSVLDSPYVKMVFRGDIDLARKKIDVVALVAPLRTVDRIIGAIPVIGKLFDGAFLSVPVRITGDLDDPDIIPLSPTAVGEELFGFMKRTFSLPITLIQPLVAREEKSSDDGKPAPTLELQGTVSSGN